MKKFIFFLCVALLFSSPVKSQGCIMVRNISGFGQYNLTDNAFSTSDWHININNRYFKAFRDFKGTQDQKTQEQNQSIIRSYSLDITLSRLLRNGWSVDFSLPIA